MFVILSCTVSAFAAGTDMTSGTPTALPGSAIRGGADTATAAAAATPLIKFSTGVFGIVNWSADAATKTSAGYLIGTRHLNGSKNFATTNSVTNIYWKQAAKVADGTAARTAMVSEIGTSEDASTTFAAGAGWTSY